ncbi:methionyl-tRNA formyltransferase [Thermodesulforhabdus norvegica]|uniref:Methionyl-tRNA formyltransferase n=2 Tax=Thermodesulforhabdus norvegica TaxID=39841 RepID=A0A1I4SLL0_9BACT|nr:methionyl-tRNA formyltransferase [Thermodesulforhabdus norvegica]
MVAVGRAVRIVFCGTPEFAVPTLEALYARSIKTENTPRFEILCVVTREDRPRGRGLKLTPPPVKVFAEKVGLPIFQPGRIRSPEAVNFIRSLAPDVLVVAAYGQLIPEELLKFPLGALNVHPSLLPRFRGAAPIQRAILSGDEVTGVTIMLMDEGMDTGPILAQKVVGVGECETAGSLHDRLALMGGELLVETLEKWVKGEVEPREQDEGVATYAPPISKDETIISWFEPGYLVSRRIRAFDPLPGAVTFWRGKRVKCFGASRPRPVNFNVEPGKVIEVANSVAWICAGDGTAVPVRFFQLEGRRRLGAEEFARGLPEFVGSVLGEMRS